MAARTTSAPVEVLLVEDSPGDAELMTDALGESDLALRVTVLEDGEEALEYLHRLGPHQEATRPDLILLDLHLPRKNGHEVLAEIRKDPYLRVIPVVVLTSFDTDGPDRQAEYPRCCVRKPSDLDEFALAVKKIETFWLRWKDEG
jgi:chemotaxis family two-component system response regulator Rcp1